MTCNNRPDLSLYLEQTRTSLPPAERQEQCSPAALRASADFLGVTPEGGFTAQGAALEITGPPTVWIAWAILIFGALLLWAIVMIARQVLTPI